MRIFLLQMLALLIFLGCGDANDANSEITRLEKAMQDEPSRENANALIQAYALEATKTDDHSSQEALYEKALQVATGQKVYGRAMGILQKLILDYPQPGKEISRLSRISQLFTDMRRDHANAVLVRAMEEKYPGNGAVRDLSEKATIPEGTSESLLDEMGARMFNDSILQLNKPVAREYVDACEAFALVKKDEESGAEYLHKGAETARSLQTLDKALFLYDWIIAQYPESPRAAQSLFLKAFTLDNDLNQFDKARTLYEEFLKTYPDNEFAPSAQFLLENLGKSDEELLENLQSRSREAD